MDEIILRNAPEQVGAGWVWEELLNGGGREAFAAALGRSIGGRRWFGSKTKTLRGVQLLDCFLLADAARLVLLEIDFVDGTREAYQLPLTVDMDRAAPGGGDIPAPWAALRLDNSTERGVVREALGDPAVCSEFLELIEGQARRAGQRGGELVGWQTSEFPRLHGARALEPRPVQAEQSNSSLAFGDRLIFKLFRRVEMGVNPDLEIGRRLCERGFSQTPPLAGGIEFRASGHEPWALAMAQGFVPNKGDLWHNTLGRLEQLLRGGLQDPSALDGVPDAGDSICRAAEEPLPHEALAPLERFVRAADLLGQRTAQMHHALADATDDPAFAPEPFTADDATLFVRRAIALADEAFHLLRERLPKLNGETATSAQRVLERERDAESSFDRLTRSPLGAAKIRCHGDYHLGQVLVADDDFMIIDFEGEPARPLAERRGKQPAVRDVAGMIRSYHYASCAAAHAVRSAAPPERLADLKRWGRSWYFWMSVAFLAGYRRAAGGAEFLPANARQFQVLFDACLMEKALYELRYELNNRPDWIYLPLGALEDLLGRPAPVPR